MNFSSMDYFVAAARERNITRAAERLHITQQTLSAHIANLEREVGCQLLVRRVPLELTPAGQVFLRYAVDFQCKRQALEREMGELSSGQRGVLRIGVASTRGRAILPAPIYAFQQRYPKVSVRLVETSNDVLMQKLVEGEIDLAIANFITEIAGVEIRDFYQEEVVLAVSQELLTRLYGEKTPLVTARAERGELAALEGCPFLLNSPQDIAGRLGRRLLAQAGLLPTAEVEAFNVETLLDLCVRGAGACFCPETLVKATLSQDQLSQLRLFRFGEEGRYHIRFGSLKQEYRWQVMEDFIALCLDMVSDAEE